MDLFEDTLCGVPLLHVKGFSDHQAAQILKAAATRALADSDSRILIDLSECGYLDSGALSVLLHVVRQVQGKGWLGIIGPGADLVRLFDVVGLTSSKWFRLFSDSEEVSMVLIQSSAE